MSNLDMNESLELLPGFSNLPTRAKNGILNWGKQDGQQKRLADLIEIKRTKLGKVKGIGADALKKIWTWREGMVNGNGSSPAIRPKPAKVPKSCGYIYLVQIIEHREKDKETGDLILKIDDDHGIVYIETLTTLATLITYQTPFDSTKFQVDHTPQEVLDKIIAASK